MYKTYLLLGGNVGDRMDCLRCGIELLQAIAGNITAASSVYESEPWGFDDEQWFLNQAIEMETTLAPLLLLEKIHYIEKIMGRHRTGNGYQARPIDIDVLFCGDRVINLPELVIPHPRIAERMFVLLPMAELAPDLEHPVLRCTMRHLRDKCSDNKDVNRYF